MSFLLKKSQTETFIQKLLEKNKEINLISRKNPEDQVKKLLEESKSSINILKDFFKKKNQKILDIGSGNGFPGLFFAIQFPHNSFYLCERRRNKAEALKWIGSQCGLSNLKILCQPAESLKADYNIVLSQASMSLEKIDKLLKIFLKDEFMAFLWLSKKQSFPFSFSFEKFPLSSQKQILKLNTSQVKSFSN